MSKLENFICQLQQAQLYGNTFNPWSDCDPQYDINKSAPVVRSNQLKEYLQIRIGLAKYIFLAEGLSYQGGKFTGIAMTSERIILGNHEQVPASAVFAITPERTSAPGISSSVDKLGMAEPTASIVWKAILKNKIPPEQVVLWNIFPWHPHKPDESLTNRTPTDQELALGLEYFKMLLDLFVDCKVLCLGKKSELTVSQSMPNLQPIVLRHPANGGARLFESGLVSFLNTNGTR